MSCFGSFKEAPRDIWTYVGRTPCSEKTCKTVQDRSVTRISFQEVDKSIYQEEINLSGKRG